jgi:hypothetical protein
VLCSPIVLADIAAQVKEGAEHITFGDPDFLNGPTHAMHIVASMHAAYPSLTRRHDQSRASAPAEASVASTRCQRLRS